MLSGEVRIGEGPASGGTVVLHRVSAFFSGEVDSAAVSPNGAFRLRVPQAPDPDGGDIYFASIRYQDVLYFGEAVTAVPEADAPPYVIRAYPTAVGPPPTVHVRNLFLERAEPGPGWNATDIFELHNAGAATLVASELGATWSHALPPGAEEFSVGASDLSPDAATFAGGRVRVSEAMPPGERLFVFRYRVARDSVAVPMEGPTGSMELLVREPAGPLFVRGLAPAEPVDIDGGTFRRFAGRDLAPATVRMAPREARSAAESVPILAAVMTLVLALAGALVLARSQRVAPSPAPRSTNAQHSTNAPRSTNAPPQPQPPPPSQPPPPPPAARRRVLVQVAELDEALAAGDLDPAEHRRRRARLLRRLTG